MAWIRQLPSGRWAATVYTGDPPPSDRITQTDRLKSVVETWAADLEADVRRGDFIDPRRADITVGEWWELARKGWRLERASRLRDESQWRQHVGPRWSRTKLGGILKTHVNAWVVEMHDAGVGAATIEGATSVLRRLLESAVDDGRIRTNPARKLQLPPRDAHVDRVLENDEEHQLLDRLDAVFPGRVDARLFCELMLDTGMRWEEAAAVPPELVDIRRQRIHVAWVMERDGTTRPYAKSEAGNRTVTYSDALEARVRAAKLSAPVCPGVFPDLKRTDVPERLVFHAPEGGPLRYSNWLRRVWRRGLTVEGRPRPKEPGRPGPMPRNLVTYLEDPQPTPHDLRHTYGTRLADEGVPVHDIMALMGHDDLRSAQRYMHAREDRFDRARQALDRARGRGVVDLDRRRASRS
jgi:integrase